MATMATPPATIPGFESRTTTIAGVRLHYWIGAERTGKPVILWHGFLSTSYAWREVAPALAHVWQGMVHVFPANLAVLHAAREALDIAGNFLRRNLAR
jgi:pimeloyl-ACP methyl ester carboxylesterase